MTSRASLFVLLTIPACFDPSESAEMPSSDTDATASGGSDASADGSTSVSGGSGGSATLGPDDTTGSTDDGSSGTDDGSSGIDDTTTGEAATCGDGIVSGSEVCDDGVNDGAYGGCAPDCMALGPHCGDGEANGEETCDDGNAIDGDGCNLDCVESGAPLLTLTYDSPAGLDDRAYGVSVDLDGSFVVCGTTERADLGQGIDIWTRKYAEDGSELWTNTVDGDGANDAAFGVDTDAEGNVAVTGYVTATGEGHNTWTTLYDADGDAQWTRTYDSPNNSTDDAVGVGFDADGDVYIGGHSFRSDLGQHRDLWWRKYDTAGTEQWTTSFNNPNDTEDSCEAFRVNGAGVSACVGSENETGLSQGNNLRVMVLDEFGVQLWTDTLDGPASLDDSGLGVAVSEAGDVLVCGRLRMSGTVDDYDTWIGKYGPTGVLEWTADHDSGGGFDACGGAVFDADENVIVVGTTGTSDSDVWVRKYDPDGNVLWTQTHDGPGAASLDAAAAVDVWPDGRIVVAGHEDQVVPGAGRNIWIRVYAP